MRLKLTTLLPLAVVLTPLFASNVYGQAVEEAVSSAPPVESESADSSPAAAAATDQAESKSPPAPLELVCNGAAGGTMASLPSGGFGGLSALKYGFAGNDGIEAQIRVRLFAGDDRIKIPSFMLPPFRGGNRGWYKIDRLKVTDKVITGRAAVNYVNTPTFRIDRVTTEIEISGPHGNFSGTCRKIELETAKPQF